MLKLKYFIFIMFFSMGVASMSETNINLQRARQTLGFLYDKYSVKNKKLLRENYLPDTAYRADYVVNGSKERNRFSYLWPYSGVFSGISTLYRVSGDKRYEELLEENVLPGLEEYFDKSRKPYAYSSYIAGDRPSDRYYDDNIWLGIDFTNLYLYTKNLAFLDSAKTIWHFIESGTDDVLGGGIYWCEEKKDSKNTCSNAPGAVFALRLYLATGDESFLEKGEKLYEWTKSNLQDKTDGLYFDNIRLDGTIGRAKYTYNSGQMLEAASLLYEITKEKKYLEEAKTLAQACYNYFFTDFISGKGKYGTFKLLKENNLWFIAVMFRGYRELYSIDKNPVYVNVFGKNLDWAWDYMRDKDGLFDTDWKGIRKKKKKWLLDQAAMVEMYAGLASLQMK